MNGLAPLAVRDLARVAGGALSTGSIGDIVMENSAGIPGLQAATGGNNAQRKAVSVVFVSSELQQP
jgi:hypothetical protein